jgi:hypothetical protein
VFVWKKRIRKGTASYAVTAALSSPKSACPRAPSPWLPNTGGAGPGRNPDVVVLGRLRSTAPRSSACR